MIGQLANYARPQANRPPPTIGWEAHAAIADEPGHWRMGRPVVERHASDLLSAWVGETEKRIAAAFREAEADGALLLFDEVDSFLRPRADATRSWEAMRIIEARLCATL